MNRRRDHGGVIFIDLRDRTGLAQIVFDPDNAEAFGTAERLRNEFCISITGLVRLRPEGTANAELASGEVEVLCQQVEILNASVTPPFQLDDDNLSETTRLTHRVLDLRRPQMQHNLMLRYRVSIEVRKYLDQLGFIDIETPMLTKSTPEGARDYLVPSRVNAGYFFALPQSPQLFKQMLMVSGFDRYYQITKCFRDEDLRADRQPEFTQIDCETSFLNEVEIREIFEGMIRHVFKVVQDVDLPTPFPIMSWTEAMQRYGSDKPDLRVNLEFTDMTDVMRDVDFKVFASAATTAGSRVVALRVQGGGEMSRSEIDAYTQFVGIYGAKGLAYIKVNDVAKGREGLQSPIVKNLHDAALAELVKRTGAQNGDIIFFGADRAKVVNDAIGALRVKIGHSEFGKKAGLFSGGWKPLWVVDFPCSSTTRRKTAIPPRTTRSPARRTATRTSSKAIRARPSPRPTTWCSTAGKSAAARCVSTARKCRARYSARSRSTPRRRARSSASCWTRCSMARRRMAASRSAWTASSP